MVNPLKSREEICISGWNRMLQPYIESATALSYMDTNTDNFTLLSLHMRGIVIVIEINDFHVLLLLFGFILMSIIDCYIQTIK